MQNESLFKLGYHIGSIEEIGLDINILKEIKSSSLDSFDNDPDQWMYTFQVIPQGGSSWSYSLDKVEEQKKQAKSQGKSVFQSWYYTNSYENHVYIRFKLYEYLKNIYPDYVTTFKNIFFSDSITYYKDGDGIMKHEDGNNPGRICAVLIYLNDPLEYDDTHGGHLVLYDRDSDNDVLVQPVLGNFVMLDFTKNNPSHSVVPVKNGFKRVSYLSFINVKD